jgi:aldehyde dehydrogenase (NAD+)
MGGKNAMIVFNDADPDLALDGVLWGAFGTTGQRCTATSRLIIQDGVHDELLSRLVDRARALKLGDGRKNGTDVGPLINEASLRKVERYVDSGQEEGADVLCGGRRPTGKGVDQGYFFEPTICSRVRPGMRLEQ